MDALERARFRIYALEDGAVRAAALSFCLRRGLFDFLEEGARTEDQFLEGMGMQRRVLPTLLAFLASQALIRRRADGRWANTRAASTFLVRSSPSYVGGRGLLFAGFGDAIGHLEEALSTGRPWSPAGQHDMFGGFDEAAQQWFADGMFANATHGARALMREVDFGAFRRLLDVGGSAGGYAIAIATAYPGIEATIFDLPAVKPWAEARIADAGIPGRVRFEAGSFFDDALPRGHDVLLLSSILHDWGDDDCARILHGCVDALAPGGTLVVTEPMLAEDWTGPDHPSVSGLTMAVLGGENRTRSRIGNMLLATGLADVWASPLGPQNSVVTARKLA